MRISVLTPTIRPKGLEPLQESLRKQTLQDFEWLVEMGLPWRGHDLNVAMNRMLTRARGEIIVSLQDWCKITPNALEKIDDLHRMTEKTAFTYPVLKVDTFQDEHYRGDWRPNKNDFIPYYQWETDFASAPRQMFFEIGGYDEDMDQGWSWDNVNVAHRAKMAGYAFRCYPFIQAIVWDHDKFEKHPFRGKNENVERIKKKQVEFEKGNWKLRYL